MDEAIRAFKKTETKAQIAFLVNNEPMVRLLVVWSKLPIEKVSEVKPGMSWLEFWECFELNAAVVGQFIGMTAKKTRSLIRQAQAAQLVYPDNSIHEQAQFYLNTVVMRDIPKELVRVKQDNVDK